MGYHKTSSHSFLDLSGLEKLMIKKCFQYLWTPCICGCIQVQVQVTLQQFFGWIAAIKTSQFNKLNGFSNQFWGLGGEDDDKEKRIYFRKLRITCWDCHRYDMIKHKPQTMIKKWARVLRLSHRGYKVDRFNSLRYNMVPKQLFPLFTNLSV